MRKLLILAALLLILVSAIIGQRKNPPVFAEGGIEVSFSSTPLFSETNLYPGKTLEGEITITNPTSQEQKVGLRVVGSKKTDLALASKLFLWLKDRGSGETLLGGEGGKKLSQLLLSFSEAPLFTLSPGGMRELTLTLLFDPNAGNFYQGRTLSFDFSLGFIGSTPFPRIRFPR